MIALTIVSIIGVANVDKQNKPTEKVWICTSPKAYRYHNNQDCKGLQNCSYDIIKVTISEAKDRGLTECKMCYK